MTYPPFLPINTGNAGVNPNHHYDVPFQFYDPTTAIVANAHQIISGALGGGGTYSGQATSIAAGVALDPGTVGGTAISSAFLHAGASITANALASGVALDAGTLGGITLGNAVLTLANNPQTVTGKTAFTNGLSVAGGLTVDVANVSGTLSAFAISTADGYGVDFHITAGSNASSLYLVSPTSNVYLQAGGLPTIWLVAQPNAVNEFQFIPSANGQNLAINAIGETTGGMNINSGNGPLYLNCFNGQDVILGTRAPAINQNSGFPCIPLMPTNPTGTPNDGGQVAVGWIAPISAVANTATGSYSLQTYMNGAWRTIPVGNSISSSALPATTGLYGGSGSQGQANAITVGTNLSLSGGTLSVPTTGTFSNYLPLSGGTMTGALVAMTATFTSSIVSATGTFNNSFFANTIVTATNHYNPASGGTVTISTGIAGALIFGAGTFSALTVSIPTAQTLPGNQSQELAIYFANGVNTLTWQVSSTPVYGVALPTSAASGNVVKLAYHYYTNAWMHYTTI